MFNQFTSLLLHSVLQLIIHDFKRAFEFVCYIGFFWSQQKVGKIYFKSYFFWGNGQAYFNFNMFISNLLQYLLYLMKQYPLKELMKISP